MISYQLTYPPLAKAVRAAGCGRVAGKRASLRQADLSTRVTAGGRRCLVVVLGGYA